MADAQPSNIQILKSRKHNINYSDKLGSVCSGKFFGIQKNNLFTVNLIPPPSSLALFVKCAVTVLQIWNVWNACISQHDSLQQQQQRQQQQQQQKLPLQQPASHPQLGTMSSQPQSSGMTIYRYQNHAIWYFHRRISQSEFLGRTWSNACTFIALFMAKLFSIHNNATVAVNIINEPSYPQMWLGIVSSAIQAGNSVHDSVTGGQPINFSVVDAIRHLNGRIGKPRVVRTLDVGFTNEDPRVPQSSLSFHLELLSRETSHIAAMVIVNRMTICFVARGGKLFVLDSHAHLDSHSHLPFGAMVGVSDMSSRESFLAKVKQELHLQYNLCSLTFVKFLWGSVYTNAVSFVTASFSMRLCLLFTRHRSWPLPKPGRFENAAVSSVV